MYNNLYRNDNYTLYFQGTEKEKDQEYQLELDRLEYAKEITEEAEKMKVFLYAICHHYYSADEGGMVHVRTKVSSDELAKYIETQKEVEPMETEETRQARLEKEKEEKETGTIVASSIAVLTAAIAKRRKAEKEKKKKEEQKKSSVKVLKKDFFF